VNAALLLVTSACFLGQAEGKKIAPVPPPVTTAPIVSSAPAYGAGYGAGAGAGAACGPNCGTDCGNDCGSGHRFGSRLRGMFNRDSCDTCQPTCNTHTHTRSTGCCDSSYRTWTWRTHSCASNNNCNTCDSCDNGGFFSRCRSLFQRRGNSCDSCNSCASGGVYSPGTGYPGTGYPGTGYPGTVIPGIPQEKIAPPLDKMPNPPKVAPKGTEVRIETQPNSIPQIATPPAVTPPAIIPPAPAVPNLDTPSAVPAPRDGDRREPF